MSTTHPFSEPDFSQFSVHQAAVTPESSEAEWQLLHATVSTSQDALAILDIKPNGEIKKSRVQEAIKDRIALLRQLGKDHYDQVEADIHRCYEAGKALFAGKRTIPLNGNGKQEKSGAPTANDPKEFAPEVYAAIRASLSDLNKKEEPEAGTGCIPKTLVWQKRVEPLLNTLPPALKRSIEKHAGGIAATIATAVAVIIGGGAYLLNQGSDSPKFKGDDNGAAKAPINPERPVESRKQATDFDRQVQANTDAPPPERPATKSSETPATPPPSSSSPTAKPAVSSNSETSVASGQQPASDPPLPTEDSQIPLPKPRPNITLTSVVPADAPRMPAATPMRKAVPSNTDMERYSRLATSQTALSKKSADLLKDARLSTDTPEQWALYSLALKHAREDRDLAQVLKILGEMQQAFDADTKILKEKMDAINMAAGFKNSDATFVTQQACAVIGELCSLGQLDGALKFQRSLSSGKTAINRKSMSEALTFIRQTQDAYRAGNVEEHERTLMEKPDDPTAKAAIAFFRGMQLGDWSDVGALSQSPDPTLQNLATRIEAQAQLSASELLLLVDDLIKYKNPPPPGVFPLAKQLCASAKIKAEKSTTRMLADDQLINLEMKGNGAQQFLHQPKSTSSATALTRPEETQQTIDATTIPAGAVDLIDHPKNVLENSSIVRVKWDVSSDGKLQGVSGAHEWLATINIPCKTEGIKIIQTGHFGMQVPFTYSADGRRVGKAHGASAFVIPLPNGESLPILWDANMDPNIWKDGNGFYRSGFDLADRPLTGDQNQSLGSVLSLQLPCIPEDRPLVFLAVVHIVPGGFSIETSIREAGKKKTLVSIPIILPVTTKGGAYLFEHNGKKTTQKPGLTGFGVAGGKMTIEEGASIFPLPPPRPVKTH